MQNGAAEENMKVNRKKKKGKRKKGLKSHLLGNKLDTKIYKCLCIHSLIC